MKKIPVRGEILISYHLYFTKTDLKQRDTQLSNNKPYYLSHKRNGVCAFYLTNSGHRAFVT